MTTQDERLARLPEMDPPATTHPDRATVDKAHAIFNRDQSLTWDEALSQARVELDAERAQRAQAEAAERTYTNSFVEMTSCAFDGKPATGNLDGLCDDCRKVDFLVAAEELSAEVVNGLPRREWVMAGRAQRAQAGQKVAS
jgi:hypothetical protein